jgi:hypothetical protein
VRAARLLGLGALALAGATCSPPAGLVLDVEVGDFTESAAEVRVVLHAPNGFAESDQASGYTGPGVVHQDVDGDGKRDLVVRFLTPFPKKEHVLVTIANDAALTITADATAFDASKIIASGAGTVDVPAGGRATLNVALAAASPGPVGPGTRSTDLLTDQATAAIRGTIAGAGVSALAVCNLDGVGKRNDVVVGVASYDHDATRVASGAVFVVFNAGTASVKLDPANASQLSFFGDEAGDHLGAAVGCADFDADGFDDLVVGAPDAAAGAGRVYLVKGRQALNGRSVDVAPTASPTSAPDAAWGGAVGTAARLGAVLAIADKQILAAAPAAKAVHLLPPAGSPGTLTDTDAANHPVFTGLVATSLAAGNFDTKTTGLDVALGEAAYKPANAVKAQGAVFLFANVDPKSTAGRSVSTAESTMVGKGGLYGQSVLALDSTGHGQDLLVGAPAGDDGHGLVYLYEHDGDFFAAAMRDFATTAKSKLDLGDLNGGFGASLAPCANGSTFGLAVGAPETKRQTRSAIGAAYVLGTGGAFPVIERLYGAGENDRLGSLVGCGDFDGDGTGDLVTAAPAAKGDVATSGVVYVLDTHTGAL